jgi:hypothetical protein
MWEWSRLSCPILSRSPFRAKYDLKTLRVCAKRMGTRSPSKSASTNFATTLLKRPLLRWLSSTSNAKEFLTAKSPPTWASQSVPPQSACSALLKPIWRQVNPCVRQVVSLRPLIHNWLWKSWHSVLIKIWTAYVFILASQRFSSLMVALQRIVTQRTTARRGLGLINHAVGNQASRKQCSSKQDGGF